MEVLILCGILLLCLLELTILTLWVIISVKWRSKQLSARSWKVRRKAVKKLTEKLGWINFVSETMYRHVLQRLFKRLNDDHQGVRREAALAFIALTNEGFAPRSSLEPCMVEAFMTVLEDKEERVRNAAVIALGQTRTVRAVQPLIMMLNDEMMSVRLSAVEALKQVIPLVHILVFGHNGESLVNQEHTLYDPDISDLTVPMGALREILIDAETCDQDQIEAFTRYMIPYLGEKYLQKHVTVHIYNAPGDIRFMQYNPFHFCKRIEVYIETILFGSNILHGYAPHTTWSNPDMSDCLIPLLRLRQIVIHTGTYDFHLVERFLTYAINYTGQSYLRKHVDVYLCGDAERLHPNLRNNLTNLCRSVHMHETNDVLPPMSTERSRGQKDLRVYK